MQIVLLSEIASGAVRSLQAHHDVHDARGLPRQHLLDIVQDAEIVVLRSGVSVDVELIAHAPALRLVIRAGSGIDNVDLLALAARGIEVARIPEPGADAVAEMTFALMLGLMRHVVTADRSVREGIWAKHQLTGHRLAGRTLGIIGAGTIGRRVGQLGAAWSMRPLGCVERPSSRVSAHLADLGIELASFDEILARADVVTVHVPLTPATHHLLDHAALSRMQPGSFLVSLARGGVVDELALREALLCGHLAGAALDVHAEEGPGLRSPLADLPNVVLTPHIGAGTHEAQVAIGRRVVELVDAAAARPPTHPIVPELTS